MISFGWLGLNTAPRPEYREARCCSEYALNVLLEASLEKNRFGITHATCGVR
jgi:hypothetical protein